MIATLQEQYCKAHICSDFANERFMDDGLAQDQKFVKALCQWANKAPSTLAREMGLAATTITRPFRSEEHTSELQSLMRISYAVFCLTKKNITYNNTTHIKAEI